MSRDVQQEIDQLVKTKPIVLFMKGTPGMPQCGFSFRTVEAIKACKVPFESVNVLADPDVREGIKLYGDDLDDIAATANHFGDVLRGIPGAIDVDVQYSPGSPELELHVDRDAATQRGVPLALVELRSALLQALDIVCLHADDHLAEEVVRYIFPWQTTAMRLAHERGLTMVPSFHRDLVAGVSVYALELMKAAPTLDTIYVPIGLGSGICGVMAVRDALDLPTKIVGVVSTEAPAYALSFAAGKVVPTNSANTMADGMAVRGPDAEALSIILKGADRIVQVSDAEVTSAMRAYYEDTHQLTEGAGAASLAALMQERDRMKGRRIGLILSGGNIDREVYLRTLAGA